MSTELSVASTSEPDLEEVINRLRTSKKRCGERAYSLGRESGRHFAKDQAEVSELECLEVFLDGLASVYQTFTTWCGEKWPAYSNSERLFFVMRPGRDDDFDAATEFWSIVTDEAGHLAAKDQFLEGFVDGAMRIWEEVKTKL